MSNANDSRELPPRVVTYIGFYDAPGNSRNRASCLAAIDKMDYISEVITRAGWSVRIVSPAWCDVSDSWFRLQSGGRLNIGPKKCLILCPSAGTRSRLLRRIVVTFSLIWLFLWLVRHLGQQDRVLAYHSPWLSMPIRFAKRVRGFELILEVEEFYAAVWQVRPTLARWERLLVQRADRYIAVSDALAAILGAKTEAVVYGNYQVPRQTRELACDGKVHVIYAGSIEHTRHGAFTAVECALNLPEKYVVHLCGFGDRKATAELMACVETVNGRLGRTACIYHGTLPESQFAALLSRCTVALNPQRDGQKMNMLYPSKIVKYLAYNLRVVTTPIRSIRKSGLQSVVTFASDGSAAAHARTITALDLAAPFEGAEVIKRLDEEFGEKISQILNGPW